VIVYCVCIYICVYGCVRVHAYVSVAIVRSELDNRRIQTCVRCGPDMPVILRLIHDAIQRSGPVRVVQT